jgi:hypothetical protein
MKVKSLALYSLFAAVLAATTACTQDDPVVTSICAQDAMGGVTSCADGGANTAKGSDKSQATEQHGAAAKMENSSFEFAKGRPEVSRYKDSAAHNHGSAEA